MVQLAKILGFTIYHHRPAWTNKGFRTTLTGHKGFPDLLLAKPPRLIFAELKVGYNKLSPEQEQWLETLRQVPGIEVYYWKEKDFDEIVGVLQGR